MGREIDGNYVINWHQRGSERHRKNRMQLEAREKTTALVGLDSVNEFTSQSVHVEGI